MALQNHLFLLSIKRNIYGIVNANPFKMYDKMLESVSSENKSSYARS